METVIKITPPLPSEAEIVKESPPLYPGFGV